MNGLGEENETNDTEILAENLDDFQERTTKDSLDENIFEYLSFLHSEGSLSRKIIHEIYNKTKKELIDPILRMVNDENLMKNIDEAFENLNTFYKFKKELKKRQKIVEPKHHVISEQIGLAFKNGEPIYKSVEVKVSLMPIKQTFKSFLEIPNIFNAMMENIQQLEADSQGPIRNFVQGKLWKNIKSKFQDNEILIPCFIYHDDFEVDNPLGSNAGANKIAAFYFSFPTIPQHLLSSPNYIFDGMLFHSEIKTENLDLAMEPIIDEFKELETEGLTLDIDGKEIKVFIILSLLIGDNLAQNELLGYSKSFNSNFYCRFCKMPKHLARKTFEIDEQYIRSITTYNNDLEEKQYGTMKNCSLNKLGFFHATNNYSCDIMHDIYEGVAVGGVVYEKKNH